MKKKSKTPVDLASRLERGRLTVMKRYFGMMQGPSDLSTNKTYRRRLPAIPDRARFTR
jgi:hypothetical protein